MSIHGECWLVMNNHTCENCHSLDYSVAGLPGNRIEVVCKDCSHIEFINEPQHDKTKYVPTTKDIKEFQKIYDDIDWEMKI